MLGNGDVLDENDWDPEFLAKELVPKYLDSCPTIPICQFFQKPGAIWMHIGRV
jgi:hypothetical protein